MLPCSCISFTYLVYTFVCLSSSSHCPFSLFDFLFLSLSSVTNSHLPAKAATTTTTTTKHKVEFTVGDQVCDRKGEAIDWNAQFQGLLQLPESTEAQKLDKYEQLSALSKVSSEKTPLLWLITKNRISCMWQWRLGASSFQKHTWIQHTGRLSLFLPLVDTLEVLNTSIMGNSPYLSSAILLSCLPGHYLQTNNPNISVWCSSSHVIGWIYMVVMSTLWKQVATRYYITPPSSYLLLYCIYLLY